MSKSEAVARLQAAADQMYDALRQAGEAGLHGAMVCVLHHAPKAGRLPVALVVSGAHTQWGSETLEEVGRALGPMVQDADLLHALMAGILAGALEPSSPAEPTGGVQ